MLRGEELFRFKENSARRAGNNKNTFGYNNVIPSGFVWV